MFLHCDTLLHSHRQHHSFEKFFALLKKYTAVFISFRCALRVDVMQTPRFGINNNLENKSHTVAPTFSDPYNQV